MLAQRPEGWAWDGTLQTHSYCSSHSLDAKGQILALPLTVGPAVVKGPD